MRTRIQAITDLDRLERLLRHMRQASSWQELLDIP
jgi:hypothetical protein